MPSAPLSVAVEPGSCAADEPFSSGDELAIGFFVNPASVLLESVWCIGISTALVALSQILIVDHDDAGATRWFTFCFLIVRWL